MCACGGILAAGEVELPLAKGKRTYSIECVLHGGEREFCRMCSLEVELPLAQAVAKNAVKHKQSTLSTTVSPAVPYISIPNPGFDHNGRAELINKRTWR